MEDAQLFVELNCGIEHGCRSQCKISNNKLTGAREVKATNRERLVKSIAVRFRRIAAVRIINKCSRKVMQLSTAPLVQFSRERNVPSMLIFYRFRKLYRNKFHRSRADILLSPL